MRVLPRVIERPPFVLDAHGVEVVQKVFFGLEMVGKLKFDELESVNHVTFRANTLIVAAGPGGVKVVRIERNKEQGARSKGLAGSPELNMK